MNNQLTPAELRKRVAEMKARSNRILDAYVRGGEVTRDDISELLDCIIFQGNYIAVLETRVSKLEAVAEALAQYFGYPSCPACDSGVEDDGLPCYCFDGTRLMDVAKERLQQAGRGDE